MFLKIEVYLLIALFPYLCLADSRNIQCPDGSICPSGKTCCESPNRSFQCCDLVEEERYNKKIVPAIPPSISQDIPYETCNGTYCSDSFCCDYQKASCCSFTSCCPSGYHCCTNILQHQQSYSTNIWCCKTKQRCANSYMYCISGVASLSPGLATIILIFIIAMASKRFY